MKVEHCAKCNAEIVWLKTKNGKSMPVVAKTVSEGDTVYDHTRHTSHFADCPFAQTFRKRVEKKWPEHPVDAFIAVMRLDDPNWQMDADMEKRARALCDQII